VRPRRRPFRLGSCRSDHPTIPALPSNGFRFWAKIISRAGWFYLQRLLLCYRDGKALRAEWGMVVSSETGRLWWLTFGHQYANHLRRWPAQPGDTWHPDAVLLTINGNTPERWRAVDHARTCWISSCSAATGACRVRNGHLCLLNLTPAILVNPIE